MGICPVKPCITYFTDAKQAITMLNHAHHIIIQSHGISYGARHDGAAELCVIAWTLSRIKHTEESRIKSEETPTPRLNSIPYHRPYIKLSL